MTELSFLLDLLLNEKLSVKVKTKLTERIKEIESNMTKYPGIGGPYFPPVSQGQAPSTQKLLNEMAMHPLPVEPVVPATQAAAQALNERAKLMSGAGLNEPGRKSPRKF